MTGSVETTTPADDPVAEPLAKHSIRVLLADDQALIRGAFAALIGLESDLVVVAQVGTGDDVLPTALRTRPDVALLDVQMPGIDGLAAAAALTERLPTCRVIILTTFGRPGYLRRAMAAKAAGFLVKDAPPETLIDAIRRVHAGLRVVDPTLAAESLSLGESPLTARERDVLIATVSGGTISEIAGRLFLSEGTVRNHLSSVIGKTGARTRADAVRIATERGWI
ncbi:MAG: response regulator transcription factor [Nakamurella sp.]